MVGSRDEFKYQSMRTENAVSRDLDDAKLTNEERSKLEVEEFRSAAPERYFAYHGGPSFGGRGVRCDITTWVGDRLATVVDAGPVWTSNFGDQRQTFRCVTEDGVHYGGTAYLSAGDYVRLHKIG